MRGQGEHGLWDLSVLEGVSVTPRAAAPIHADDMPIPVLEDGRNKQAADGRLRRRRTACAGLLSPSLNVHTHYEEPQHHRSFPEEAGGQIVRGQMVCERR